MINVFSYHLVVSVVMFIKVLFMWSFSYAYSPFATEFILKIYILTNKAAVTCTNRPCKNGATCKDTAKGYTCTCDHTGTHCEGQFDVDVHFMFVCFACLCVSFYVCLVDFCIFLCYNQHI